MIDYKPNTGLRVEKSLIQFHLVTVVGDTMNEHLNTDEAVSNVHGLGHVDGSPDILLGQTKVVDCTVGQTELLHLRGWQIAFKTQDQFVD